MTASPIKNKRSFLRLSIIFGLLALALSTGVIFTTRSAEVAGMTYYVNCSASSNGSGTQSSPWNTLTTVDSTTFHPGDTILFARGTTCSGELDPLGSGSSGSPISIDAYGTGALPIISGGTNSAALELSDQQYWTIADLEITGGNPRSVYITGNTANATLNSIHLTNLTVTGTQGTITKRSDNGLVVVEPQASLEKFNDIVLNGITAYSTSESEGIYVSGSSTWSGYGSQALNTNVTVENSTVHDVGADGILVMEAQNATLQHNVVYNSGQCKTCSSEPTPDGLWEWYCWTCTVQYNESYDNTSWNSQDGGDYDLDYHNVSNTIQYNYGHDSKGYCVAVFGVDSAGATTNGIIRYNVCANDNQQGGTQGEIFLTTWNGGSINGIQIYNNTIYANPSSGTPAVLSEDNMTFSGSNPNFFKNNIIYTTSTFVVQDFHLKMDHNLYYSTSTSTLEFEYQNGYYSTFSAYQSGSGQDAHSIYANPKLNNVGYHGIGAPVQPYTLASGSPAFSAGTNVCSGISGCDMGTRDFFGNTITTTGTHNIGAYEATSSVTFSFVKNGDLGRMKPSDRMIAPHVYSKV